MLSIAQKKRMFNRAGTNILISFFTGTSTYQPNDTVQKAEPVYFVHKTLVFHVFFLYNITVGTGSKFIEPGKLWQVISV